MDKLSIRQLDPDDYHYIVSRVNAWWGRLPVRGLLPKLFFHHFNQTSFVAEIDHGTVGFLIGFLSQSRKDEAYIHFVGVDPDYRQKGIGKRLYENFFCTAKEYGRCVVRSITSPRNTGSIGFHRAMGFEIEPGNLVVNDVAVTKDYDGEGSDRVLFYKSLDNVE